MRSIPRPPSSPAPPAIALGSLFALLAVLGCGAQRHPVAPGGTPTPTTTLSGYYAGGGDGGKVSLSIDLEALARAIGGGAADSPRTGAYATMSRESGGAAILSGSYDAARDTLRLTGGGYAVTGGLVAAGPPAILAGSYEGPYGGGRWRCLAGHPDSIRVYCGSFQSDGTPLAGRWHFLISRTTLYGLAFIEGDSTGLELQGSATGTGIVRTISASGGDGTRSLSTSGSLDTAVDQASGSWNLLQGANAIDQGSWTAARCLDGTTSGN